MYRLTEDPSAVLRDDGTLIPLGHRWWDDYQAWLAEGNTPAAADQRSLGQVVADQLAALAKDYTLAMAALIASYPEIETQSWTRQASDAKRYLAWLSAGSQGDAPVTDLLSSIWTARAAGGIAETLEELAQKVVAKDVQYSTVVGTLTGRRHAAEATIEAAGDIAAVLAVTWSFALSLIV